VSATTLDDSSFCTSLSFDSCEDSEPELEPGVSLKERLDETEYILTQDDVEDYSPNEIQRTFRNFGDETQPPNFQQLR
jgi:hypothetical protein